ncbi:MAG: prepilin-type N-terminal cleavage/methylation domain-containing protein [Eubacteriales bacterium]|nr:prepilin-type N-terminal cleavage/methylation domain-containing protein [Eubacteriales bacterium]
MRRRKGFTLVEVAVSLVLVGLVIVSVYVTIASTTRTATKNKIHNFAVHEIENIVDCFAVPEGYTGDANLTPNLTVSAALGLLYKEKPVSITDPTAFVLYFNVNGDLLGSHGLPEIEIEIPSGTIWKITVSNSEITAQYVTGKQEVICSEPVNSFH